MLRIQSDKSKSLVLLITYQPSQWGYWFAASR